ncbi:hypothetical protein F4677DRAFT_372546 [Hypoxylon crocopeplum]|nr:hypothetical protein F4677DRAFT_372546 [Hypoxylon crocopeplum]
MCDVQVLTGIGILVSGFSSLSCGLAAYHWRIVVSLTWFSSVTHLTGLTILRNHLRAHAWKRNIRFGLMFILLVGLIVALVPTGFFSWEELGPKPINMADSALCYFDVELSKHIRYARSCSKGRADACQDDPLEYTTAFQTMVISIFLLAFGFLTRSGKVFRPLSKTCNSNLRHPLSVFSQNILAERTKQEDEQKLHALHKANILRIIFFWPLLGLFISCRLMAGLASSMLAEVYWLVAAMVWGTMRIFSTRNHAWMTLQSGTGLLASSNQTDRVTILDEENQWTTGQILPVLLLVAPLFTTASLFASQATKDSHLRLQEDTQNSERSSNFTSESNENTHYPFNMTNSTLAKALTPKYMKRPP